MPHEDVTNFDRVDEAGTPERFVTFLDTAFGIEGIKAMKRRTFELLDAEPGHRILDVGCGTGEDARSLVDLVSPRGNVSAVDVSREMVSEARKRHGELSESSLNFSVGDVAALDFESGVFDACRIERTLIHVPDPVGAVHEMVRVLRRGGRLVAFEPDFKTFVVDSAHRQVSRRILSFWVDSFRSEWVACHLPALFQECGMMDVYVEPRTAILDFDLAHQLFISGTLERSSDRGWRGDLRGSR
ncbi:class I SAM-dependent methyltransferase [Halomonas sp. I1]|uniref:methyltransferase domain-containing protein n=1 Tax=Halomonas sp. I1 TaxID=393536 RepID=UPI0028E02406|nr:methyltransferase domain-containing protein [Halomonas sp. I1]MDT8895867.1 class I SAM-dependent methyltransferase [Halomonas sp. I1]